MAKEEKQLRWLYETTVLKQSDEKVTEKREEGGQTIEVTKTIKKVKPIKIALLKPGRRVYESAEIFYAKQIAEFIKAGLLPYSLVAKRYANDGGPLSEPEKVKLENLKKDAEALEAKFFELIGDGEEKVKERNELLIKINSINSEVNLIQNAYADIFENTAEFKARNKTIDWWSLHLAYIDEDGTGYKPVFAGLTDEEKLNSYDEIDYKEDLFLNECIRKISYLVSFWFAAKNNLSNIDFASMDKLYTEKLSEYKVEEPKPEEKPDVDIKVEDKEIIPEADKQFPPN